MVNDGNVYNVFVSVINFFCYRPSPIVSLYIDALVAELKHKSVFTSPISKNIRLLSMANGNDQGITRIHAYVCFLFF